MSHRLYKKRLRQTRRAMKYNKIKIIYHENGHMLFAYFFGFKCKHVNYRIDASVNLKGENLVVEFESKAFANIDLPEFIEYFFQYVTNGGNIQEFCVQQKIKVENVISATKSYLTVLLAGYEAENYFFNRIRGARYFREKAFTKKYSQDMTVENNQHDLVKAKILMKAIFNESSVESVENQIRRLIRKVISQKKMRQAFRLFYKCSFDNGIIYHNKIDDELKKIGFYEWANKMMERRLNN